MSASDITAVEVARSRRNLKRSQLEEDTRFIDEALRWALNERTSGRLLAGMPITLVKFDFAAPSSARLGPEIRLNNAEVRPGAIHLSNPNLKLVRVDGGLGELATVGAHQDALEQRQLIAATSVTLDPVAGTAHVRAECAPTNEPMPIRLASNPNPIWPGTGLQPLEDEIRSFHQSNAFLRAVAPLLVDCSGPRPRMRTVYRDAVYLHLTYQVGLTQEHGYKLVPGRWELRVIHAGSQAERLVSVVGTRSSDPVIAQRTVERLISSLSNPDKKLVSVSCVACPSTAIAESDQGSAPVGLFHRHLDAA